MKLLVINKSGIQTYFFNPSDSQSIKERCRAAGKQWSDNLLGFFINGTREENYAAITVKATDGHVESMEYLDLDESKPEFTISNEFLDNLSKKTIPAEITLAEFDAILQEILDAPLKARKWEVYPEINRHFPDAH